MLHPTLLLPGKELGHCNRSAISEFHCQSRLKFWVVSCFDCLSPLFSFCYLFICLGTPQMTMWTLSLAEFLEQEYTMSEKHHPLEPDHHLHPEKCHVVFTSVNRPQHPWEQRGNDTSNRAAHFLNNRYWPVILSLSSIVLSPGVGLLRQFTTTLWWPTSSGCLSRAVTFTRPSWWLTQPTSSESGSSFSSAGVSMSETLHRASWFTRVRWFTVFDSKGVKQ